MKTPRIVRSAAIRGRRGIVLFVSGALAMGIGVAGVRALANGSPSARTHTQAKGTVTQTPVVPPAVMDSRPSVASTQPSPSPEPAPDPNALADGVYPTLVRAVDVQGATFTVDVLQVFTGAEQRRAAIEDGVDWQYVMYDPVYIRNENPLLRTLPVAREARIALFGRCDEPNRRIGLTQVRRETKWSGEGFYWELTVVGGDVVAMEERVAPPGGC
jgi:hypothetical protein